MHQQISPARQGSPREADHASYMDKYVRKTSRSGKHVLLTSSIIIALVSAYNVLGRVEINSQWPYYITFISILWLVLYASCSYLHFRTPYLFTSAYVLMLSLFHLGITIPDTLGLLEMEGWSAGPLSMWIERASWYTILSLSCVGIGFSLSLGKTVPNNDPAILKESKAQRHLAVLYWNGIGLFLASMVFLSLAIYAVGNLLNYSRSDIFRGVGDTRGLGAFLYIFPASVMLLVIGARTKKQKVISLIIALLAIALIMLSGYRTSALFPLLVGTILWTKTGHKIPRLYIITIITFVLIAIPAVSTLRALGSYGSLDKSAIVSSIENADISRTFIEIGQSAGVAAHIFRLVPKEDPYRYGATYLQQLRRSVPNLTGQQSVSDRIKGKTSSYTNRDAIRNMPPADWLTFRIAPEKFNIGQGVGFSAIGEPYLNFGISGVILFFGALGYFLGKLDGKVLLFHPTLLFFSTAILWHLTRTVRDDFGNFIKPAIFTLIVLVIWKAISHFLNPAYAKQSNTN